MATILDYYKYSYLAAAAYVDLGLQSRQLVDGAEFADAAAALNQRRLPSLIASYLFDANLRKWGRGPVSLVVRRVRPSRGGRPRKADGRRAAT